MNLAPVAALWVQIDLSVSCDQKVIMLLPPMEKYLMGLYQRIVFAVQIW